MYINRIIHKINENTFQVKKISSINRDDFNKQIQALGTTFPDVTATGWCKTEYQAGKFIVQWRTNFNYGKQTYGYAFILYINATKGTRTYIDYKENVHDLEVITEIMNYYANLSLDDVWELLENTIDRLGLYHSFFKLKKDYEHDLESGYDWDSHKQITSPDYDFQCFRYLKTSMESAVRLNMSIQVLYRLSRWIENEGDIPILNDLIERLQKLIVQCDEDLPYLISNGKVGNDHFIGNYDIYKYPYK